MSTREYKTPAQTTDKIMALKFSDKLNLLRRGHRWSVRQMTEKIWGDCKPEHIDRLEYLLAGKHEPKAADIVRIMNALEFYFDPEDFEGEGIPERKI